MVAKVEWHQGELFPRVGFIVTNMSTVPEGVVHFYIGRSTAEQWIKEGKYALKIGARLMRHTRRLVFQFAEVAVPRDVFRQVLERIGGLHAAPG